jgi:FKBP-type peptidyl-prolyl cis-trans isomerase FkpA/FKBP-type peptidyl-prolyl cis-trans isomerase FklB
MAQRDKMPCRRNELHQIEFPCIHLVSLLEYWLVQPEGETMKKGLYIVSASTLALVLVSVGACTKVKLNTDKKKASYAIGQQLGNNFKQQGLEVDADAIAAAIKDAAAGKNQMSKEDMQKAMMNLQAETHKKQQEMAETNAKSGEEFLEKNKTAEGVKVTKSGLQYIMEKEGDGKSPTAHDTVKCNYVGTLIDGTKFDSSYDRGEPATFPLDAVIPGWTEGIPLMKVGGKIKLFVPPELAYGPSGRPGIPPNSTLIFEVELLGIVKADKKTK